MTIKQLTSSFSTSIYPTSSEKMFFKLGYIFFNSKFFVTIVDTWRFLLFKQLQMISYVNCLFSRYSGHKQWIDNLYSFIISFIVTICLQEKLLWKIIEMEQKIEKLLTFCVLSYVGRALKEIQQPSPKLRLSLNNLKHMEVLDIDEYCKPVVVD